MQARHADAPEDVEQFALLAVLSSEIDHFLAAGLFRTREEADGDLDMMLRKGWVVRLRNDEFLMTRDGHIEAIAQLEGLVRRVNVAARIEEL